MLSEIRTGPELGLYAVVPHQLSREGAFGSATTDEKNDFALGRTRLVYRAYVVSHQAFGGVRPSAWTFYLDPLSGRILYGRSGRAPEA